MHHRGAIESALFNRVCTLFNFEPSIVLYDLTHTLYVLFPGIDRDV